LILCSSAVPAAAAGEFVDSGTGRNGMHSCPWGTFVVGINVGSNLLLCSSDFGGFSMEIVDGSNASKWQFMHACPDGMAMTGIHVGANLLACAPFNASLAKARRTDPTDRNWWWAATQRSGMHACPTGLPMSGIDVSNNVLACGSSGATQDNGTQRHGMHSCPVTTFVVGLNVGDDVLMCMAGGYFAYTAAQEGIDTGTQVQAMHACPDGFAVTGVNVGSNLLACAPYGGGDQSVNAWRVDQVSDSQVRACPLAYTGGPYMPMSGLHLGRNLLLCGAGPFNTRGEFIDAATMRNGIRSCPGGAFLTGEHQDRDLLMCSSAFANQGLEYLDYSTVVGGNSHGCLAGYEMTGLSVSRNVFGCARTDGAARARFWNGERLNMLACEADKAMYGLNAGSNWAFCGVH
jgi:hypothetical protein